MHPPMPSYTTCWIYWLWITLECLHYWNGVWAWKSTKNRMMVVKAQQWWIFLGYDACMANDLTLRGWRTDTAGKRFVVRAVVDSVMASRDWIRFGLFLKYLIRQKWRWSKRNPRWSKGQANGVPRVCHVYTKKNPWWGKRVFRNEIWTRQYQTTRTGIIKWLFQENVPPKVPSNSIHKSIGHHR